MTSVFVCSQCQSDDVLVSFKRKKVQCEACSHVGAYTAPQSQAVLRLMSGAGGLARRAKESDSSDAGAANGSGGGGAGSGAAGAGAASNVPAGRGRGGGVGGAVMSADGIISGSPPRGGAGAARGALRGGGPFARGRGRGMGAGRGVRGGLGRGGGAGVGRGGGGGGGGGSGEAGGDAGAGSRMRKRSSARRLKADSGTGRTSSSSHDAVRRRSSSTKVNRISARKERAERELGSTRSGSGDMPAATALDDDLEALLNDAFDDLPAAATPALPSKSKKERPTATVVRAFEPRSESEIALAVGDTVTVKKQESDGWWLGTNKEGKTGWFESRCVQLAAEKSAVAPTVPSKVPTELIAPSVVISEPSGGYGDVDALSGLPTIASTLTHIRKPAGVSKRKRRPPTRRKRAEDSISGVKTHTERRGTRSRRGTKTLRTQSTDEPDDDTEKSSVRGSADPTAGGAASAEAGGGAVGRGGGMRGGMRGGGMRGGMRGRGAGMRGRGRGRGAPAGAAATAGGGGTLRPKAGPAADLAAALSGTLRARGGGGAGRRHRSSSKPLDIK